MDIRHGPRFGRAARQRIVLVTARPPLVSRRAHVTPGHEKNKQRESVNGLTEQE